MWSRQAVVDYTSYIVSCFRRKLAMHVKFWHSNWRQNITLVSTKRFTSERAIKIRVFAWYWVAFYARTPILRATCHVKFVIMVRVIVITLDRTRQCCSNLLVSSRIWYYICTLDVVFWQISTFLGDSVAVFFMGLGGL